MNQKRTQNPDPTELIKKYASLLWQKKVWIFSISILVAILWGVIFKFIIEQQSEYTTTAVIKFEDPRGRSVGAMTEFANIGTEGNVAILKSSSFLTKVADSLKLNFFLRSSNASRFEFFKYIDIKTNVNFGNYTIKLLDNSVTLYFTNIDESIKNKIVKKQSLSNSDTIHFNISGLKFGIDKNILLQQKEIELGLNPKPVAVDYLKGKLITSLDRRTQTLLTISFSMANPFDAAYTLNTIIKMYINSLLDVKRYKTLNILKSLEDQLAVAQTELEISEKKLQRFREKNPYLFLSGTGSELVSNLSDAQTSINQNTSIIQRLNSLIGEVNSSSMNDNDRLYLSLIDILLENNVVGLQQIVNQFNDLIAEKNDLISIGYSTQSLQVQELQNRMTDVKNNILDKAINLLNKLKNSESELRSTLTVNQNRLNRLPQNEIRLAELQRDQEVKSQIYSNILIRYNEAKISDAAIIPEAMILDEAKEPLDYGSGTMIFYLLGPILGLIIAIGIFVSLDILNSNIRGISDVEDKIGVSVLSTIPVILDENEIPNELRNEKELDTKLITSSYTPNIASEKFRLIRTKLSMKNNNSNAIIFTSLAANEGKSLVTANLAITFAQLKVPTILLDCDLRRGVLHNSFNCNKKPGLTDLLVKNAPITTEEISNLIQNTHVPNLFLVSSGMQVPNPSELLGGLRMKQFIETLGKKFSRIIIDTPPIDILPDALVLNNIIHNFVMVVRYDRIKINKLLNKFEEYASIKDDLQGVIINAVKDVKGDEYHSYSYYHY